MGNRAIANNKEYLEMQIRNLTRLIAGTPKSKMKDSLVERKAKVQAELTALIASEK